MKSLKDRVAVITGAGRGIGKEMAARFASRGSHVALIDVTEDAVQSNAEALRREYGVRTLGLAADVSDAASVDQAAASVIGAFGRADILVNNAGILRDATLAKMTPEQFDQVIAVNLRGVFLCAKAFSRSMVENKYGKIVSISSVASRGNFGQTNYSAAKAGLIGMTKTWALELSKHGIHVNAIAPGLIATEMTQSIPEEIRNRMIEAIPLRRMGTPTEVADLACFLASDDASYIQGEVIHINGGFLT